MFSKNRVDLFVFERDAFRVVCLYSPAENADCLIFHPPLYKRTMSLLYVSVPVYSTDVLVLIVEIVYAGRGIETAGREEHFTTVTKTGGQLSVTSFDTTSQRPRVVDSGAQCSGLWS